MKGSLPEIDEQIGVDDNTHNWYQRNKWTGET